MGGENDFREEREMGKKLSEMQSGAKVHLTASAGLNTLEFDTSIVQAGEGHIIVEPIKHDDKILNFSNNDIIKNIGMHEFCGYKGE